MQTKDWITTVISIIALVFSLITFIKTIRWNIYKHYLEQKRVIMNNFEFHSQNLVINYYDYDVDKVLKNWESVFSVNVITNHTSLRKCINNLVESILDNKNFKKTILYCQGCNKFYKSNSIKLIQKIISSGWFTLPIYQFLLPQFRKIRNNENNLLNLNFIYIDYFDINVKLYYSGNSLKEFIIFNVQDVENFNFKNWIAEIYKLNKKDDEFKQNQQYIIKIIKEFENHNFKSYLNKKINNPNFDFSFENFIILKTILDWYLKEQWLEQEKVLDSKNNILLSITKCHYCLFLKLGLKQLIDIESWKK